MGEKNTYTFAIKTFSYILADTMSFQENRKFLPVKQKHRYLGI